MNTKPNSDTASPKGAKPSTQNPKSQLDNDYGTSSDTASNLTDKAKDAAQSEDASKAAETARKAVKDTTDATLGKVADKVSATQSAAADRIRKSAEAMNAASSRYPEGSIEREAAERIARTLNSTASQVGSVDIQSVASELDQFARRHPAIFAGCAALVGFAAARAMKASARRADTGGQPYAAARGAQPYRSIG